MKKKILSICFIMLAVALLCGCGKKETPVEDLLYEIVDGEVVITGYNGTDREIIIPAKINDRPVTTIGEGAFHRYDLISVEFPNTLKVIEENAFSGCRCLEKIKFPKSLERLEMGAFYYNEALKNVELPEGLLYLGYGVFDGCEGIAELEIPRSLEKFQTDASVIGGSGNRILSPVGDETVLVVYRDSTAHDLLKQRGWGEINYRLKEEERQGGEESPESDFQWEAKKGDIYLDDERYRVNGVTITRYIGNDAKVTIPDRIDGKWVVSISASAFEGTDIKEVYIEGELTVIRERAFADCKNLKKVVLPSHLIKLGTESFAGCSQLHELKLPERVELDFSETWNEEKGVYEYDIILPIAENDKTVLIVKDGSNLFESIKKHEEKGGKVNYKVIK